MDYIHVLQLFRAVCYSFLTLASLYLCLDLVQAHRRALAAVFGALSLFWLTSLITLTNLLLGQDAEAARIVLTIPLVFQVGTYVALLWQQYRTQKQAPGD